MYIIWSLTRGVRTPARIPGPPASPSEPRNPRSPSQTPLFNGRASSRDRPSKTKLLRYLDVVDVYTVDLYRDEHEEEEEDRAEDGERERRTKGTNVVQRTLWKLFYLVA